MVEDGQWFVRRTSLGFAQLRVVCHCAFLKERDIVFFFLIRAYSRIVLGTIKNSWCPRER